MCDPSLENDRLGAERQAQFVKGVNGERKAGFNRRAAAADLLDLQRREHHDFALEIAENQNPFSIPFVCFGAQRGGTITPSSSSAVPDAESEEIPRRHQRAAKWRSRTPVLRIRSYT